VLFLLTPKNDIVIITTRGGFMDNKTYELIGVINYLDVVPNFVFPIFKDKKGTLYTSYTNSVDSPYIEGFEPFSNIDRFNDIRVFNRKCDNIDNTYQFDNIKCFYQVGDIAIIGEQVSENEYYLNPIDKAVDFYKNLRDSYSKIINGNDEKAINELLSKTNSDIDSIEIYLVQLDKGIADLENRVATLIENKKHV
jgi:hypothetical protein